MAVMNRNLQIQRIRQDLVRAGYDPETVDVYALVDERLTLPENRQNVAKMYRYSTQKAPGVREQKKRADVGWCDSLRNQCEIKGDQEACRMYGRDRCAPVTGKIEGCRTCNVGATRTPRRATAAKPAKTGARSTAKKPQTRAVMRDGQCMIPIAAHFRRCPPRTLARLQREGGR